jgi:hypothetical protein
MRFTIALCLISTPVLADEYIAFHSPSGNIHCGLTVSADYTGARCDIFQITAQSFTSAPADCEFDWGPLPMTRGSSLATAKRSVWAGSPAVLPNRA